MAKLKIPVCKAYKINAQHKKTMLAAGFQTYREERETMSGDWNIVYWKRGEMIVPFRRDKKVELEELVAKVIEQTKYWTSRNSRVTVSPWLTTNL